MTAGRMHVAFAAAALAAFVPEPGQRHERRYQPSANAIAKKKREKRRKKLAAASRRRNRK